MSMVKVAEVKDRVKILVVPHIGHRASVRKIVRTVAVTKSGKRRRLYIVNCNCGSRVGTLGKNLKRTSRKERV